MSDILYDGFNVLKEHYSDKIYENIKGERFCDITSKKGVYECVPLGYIGDILISDDIIHNDNDEPSIVFYTYFKDFEKVVYRKEWYNNGELHRIGGPSVIYIPENEHFKPRYFINGKEYDYSDYVNNIRKYKLLKIMGYGQTT